MKEGNNEMRPLSREEVESVIKTNQVIIDAIRDYATFVHDQDANQKYDGNKPYSFHLKGVCDLAIKYMDGVVLIKDHVMPIIFGAMFHDAIEDARQTYNDIYKFALKIGLNKSQADMATEIVYALTNEKGRNRAERANEKYYEGIRMTSYAPFVKMCDRMFNLKYSIDKKSSMAAKYIKEQPHFVQSINGGIGRYAIPQKMLDDIETLISNYKA